MRKIFFTGWATPPSLFRPLLSPEWEIVDTTRYIAQHRQVWSGCGWINGLIDTLHIQPDDALMGFSTGALLALGISSSLPVHLTLFAPALSFIQRPHHPSGVALLDLLALKQAIEKSPQRALTQFFRSARISVPSDCYSNTELLAGLTFLEEIDLTDSTPAPLSCTIYQSDDDQIIPLKSAKEVANRCKSSLIHISGGHGAIIPFLTPQ